MRWERRFASPESRRAYVRGLFSTIADRYDLITVLLSFGQDRRWKRRLAALAPLRSSGRVLDLACGTGDLAYGVASRGPQVVALDITFRMLELAGRKPDAAQDRVRFVAGDMMALPFPPATFGCVTTGYGLRNVPVLLGALHEISRVLEPGGVLLSLDFDRPPNRVVRAVYFSYLWLAGSLLGSVLHGDADTYRYIPESIRRYPGAAAVCESARAAGFASCDHRPVLGGLMAIHIAKK